MVFGFVCLFYSLDYSTIYSKKKNAKFSSLKM